MAKFQVRESHLTTAELSADMAAARAHVGIISDAAAVTIASWWQSSGTVGYVLAALASGREVDTGHLIADIDATLAPYDEHDEDPQAYLGALREWAETAPCETCGTRPQAGGMFEAECVDCYLSE